LALNVRKTQPHNQIKPFKVALQNKSRPER